MTGGKIDAAAPLDPDSLRCTVIALVAEAADLDEADVGWDETLVDDLGLDSLGIVGIFIDLAYDYGIEEPARNEDWSQYDTPAKIYGFALKRYEETARRAQ